MNMSIIMIAELVMFIAELVMFIAELIKIFPIT